ncbi:MAG: ethanolamine utilization protein EutN [Gemmatimonadetes bacterium]|nr:ethanolamine utilization protein EutN [Gemmatimonadota bacterium]
MYLARVVGETIATHRHPNLGTRKLLVVRRLGLDDTEQTGDIVALDVIGVGHGERVLVVQDGSAVRTIFASPDIPAQAVVVGVVDRVDLEPEAR